MPVHERVAAAYDRKTAAMCRPGKSGQLKGGWMQVRTQFPPEPRSAAEARHWVRDHLNDLGRADLVPSAEAGVSELVTNGILHAQTSIGLLLTRSRERVVIEVYDGSPMVHQPAVDAAFNAMTDSTIGRGLRIVRAHAQEWGVSTGSHGKAVWFQPAASDVPTNGSGERARPVAAAPADADGVADAGDDAAEEAFDLDAAIDALADAFPDLMRQDPSSGSDAHLDAAAWDDTVEVRLLAVPPFVVHHYRQRWLELVREMHLVALGPPSPQQDVARRLCTAAANLHSDLYVIERSTAAFAPAVTDDGSAVDAVFVVPAGRRQAFVEVREMAREMERSWAGNELLFVHPGKQAVQLREWWLGEFIGQIDGADPTPWPGGMRVLDEAMLSSR
jgi:anti-sigma regulatory factor (Ser/Thr protein kinase)